MIGSEGREVENPQPKVDFNSPEIQQRINSFKEEFQALQGKIQTSGVISTGIAIGIRFNLEDKLPYTAMVTDLSAENPITIKTSYSDKSVDVYRDGGTTVFPGDFSNVRELVNLTDDEINAKYPNDPEMLDFIKFARIVKSFRYYASGSAPYGIVNGYSVASFDNLPKRVEEDDWYVQDLDSFEEASRKSFDRLQQLKKAMQETARETPFELQQRTKREALRLQNLPRSTPRIESEQTIKAMEKAAEEFGVVIEVLATKGESYSIPGGSSSTVPQGFKYIQYGISKPGVMGEFWRRVEDLKKEDQS